SDASSRQRRLTVLPSPGFAAAGPGGRGLLKTLTPGPSPAKPGEGRKTPTSRAIPMIRWALVSVLALAAAAPPARAADRPNVVFVLVDDIRWDAFGCMGHPWVKTPNIDRVAREGARFTNAFVSIPLCSPSRSSFLTGRYAHATGVTTNGNNSALSHQL